MTHGGWRELGRSAGLDFQEGDRIIPVLAGCGRVTAALFLAIGVTDGIVERSAAHFWGWGGWIIHLEVNRGLHHTGETCIFISQERMSLGYGMHDVTIPGLCFLW